MYKYLLRPLLFRFTSDYAHELALDLAASCSKSKSILKISGAVYGYQNPALRQKLFGLTFPNPIGLAAGFDKNGTTVPFMQSLGFGFVEVGSVTANASTGNPKPRSFRLVKDESLINRMGLNNDGVRTISKRLKKLSADIPLGINIAKTHDPAIAGQKALDDYNTSFNLLKNHADYITLNISCPNTREGKTFEDPEALTALLDLLKIESDASLPAILIKFSVDLDPVLLDELLNVSENHAVDGYVATNTSSGRKNLNTSEARLKEIGNGGLSGKAIRDRSTDIIRQIYSKTKGEKPIIGVGGISSTRDAIDKLMAGADLLQIYTGLVYEGPGLVKKINKGLAAFLKENGIEHIYHIRKLAGSGNVKYPGR